jgi:hypothetical protein
VHHVAVYPRGFTLLETRSRLINLASSISKTRRQAGAELSPPQTTRGLRTRRKSAKTHALEQAVVDLDLAVHGCRAIVRQGLAATSHVHVPHSNVSLQHMPSATAQRWKRGCDAKPGHRKEAAARRFATRARPGHAPTFTKSASSGPDLNTIPTPAAKATGPSRANFTRQVWVNRACRPGTLRQDGHRSLLAPRRPAPVRWLGTFHFTTTRNLTRLVQPIAVSLGLGLVPAPEQRRHCCCARGSGGACALRTDRALSPPPRPPPHTCSASAVSISKLFATAGARARRAPQIRARESGHTARDPTSADDTGAPATGKRCQLARRRPLCRRCSEGHKVRGGP